VPPLYLTYLNALDVAALALTDDEILDAIESGLAAQGRKETVIEHSCRTRRSTVISTCSAAPSRLRSTSRA
jgi:hypothetical protein